MLPYVFLVLWTALVGAGIVAYGVRPRPNSEDQRWRWWIWPAGIVSALCLAVGLPALAVLYSDGPGRSQSRVHGLVLTSQEIAGRETFATACKKCHTLADAGAMATIGPNLDALPPKYDTVIDAVTHGRARGNGQMPAGLVDAAGARAVAAYVTAVAGKTSR